MVLFKTEGLSFEYPDASSKALNNVSFEVNKGEFILVMGKTGSGKSTLLKMLVPAITPYGKVTGNIINHSETVGYVPQNPELSFVSETVRGELAFAPENQRLDNNTIALRIGEIASFFNFTSLLDRKISTLSGGEKAAVAIASVIAGNVDAVILDEPMAQLDSKAAGDLINLLKRINDELGVTVVLSSHLSDGVIDLCDRLFVLEQGTVVFDNEPSQVNDDVLPFYPISAQLFDSHPLTVKKAIACADGLKEKPIWHTDKTDEIISLNNITFAYGRREPDILDGLCYKAYNGKIHCIIGANGSGKTTLLKIIAGIKKPYTGKRKVNGKIAYMPQSPQYLFTKDTVGEEIAADTAKAFGLDEYINHHPYDLSGGQQQKLALAILSEQEYDILLLDEPTKALDVFYKKEFASYIKTLNKTVIIVTHDLDFVGDVADYVSFLSDGVITLNGERRQVLANLNFYTTQVRRITKNLLTSAVSVEDLE